MICARCDLPILPGEKATPVDKFSTSGGGITLHIHATPCDSPPTQTAPISQSPPSGRVRE